MRIHISNIRNKIVLLLLVLLVFYSIAFYITKEIDSEKTSELIEEHKITYDASIDNILEIRGASFENIVEKIYTQWSPMLSFLEHPDSCFANENLDILITRYGYDILWIYDSSNQLVYNVNATIDESLDIVPPGEDLKYKLFFESFDTHFFYYSHAGLIEIRGSTINDTEVYNRLENVKGYFFLGRVWDNAFLDELEYALDCEISVMEPDATVDEQKSLADNIIPVIKSLKSWNGKDVAKVNFGIHEVLLEKFDSYTDEIFIMFIVMAIVIIVIVALFLVEWVYNPLRRISLSLVNNSPKGLEKLSRSDGEFGHLAILINKFFAQNKKLRKEIYHNEKTEETLKRSEEKFSELICHLPDFVVVHQEGIIKYVNDITCEKLGYSKSELIETPILDYIEKSDHEKVVVALMRRMKGEQVGDYEINVKDSDGQAYSAIVRSSKISYNGKPAFLSVLIDISLRKEHEQQILESRARLNAILDNLPFKAWLKDTNGRFISVNQPFAAFYNFKPEDIVGKTDKYLCSEEFVKIFEEEDSKIIESGKQFFEEKYDPENTEGKWYETFKSPIFDDKGKVIGITGISRDITEQKQKQNELIKAKENADDANIAKQQFLSTMSHEMRTPLNAIIGMANLLIEEDPKDEQLENLKTLRFSANHLLSLISDILDFSKIEAGKIDIQESDFDMHELIEDFNQMFRMKAEEKNIELEYRIGEGVPEMLKGDSVRLKQILTNLVGNAIKFTDKGRVYLCIDLEKGNSKDCLLRFEVLDTGIGIDTDQLEMIFDPFVQTIIKGRNNAGGTGLGLAITKKLVDMMGGKIKVNSIKDKGSSFIFYLPYKFSKKKKSRKINAGLSKYEFELLKNVKVLLVEDNLINQIIAGKYLVKWGAIVDEAENGAIAFEKVKNNNYDIILMDLQMPEMDGFEATKSIRSLSEPGRKNIPIIALTASAFMDVKERVYKSGMNDFLTKPFDPEELNKKIHKLINKVAS